ncbi:LLM class flavin-dependent oxidoreductase [Spirosoma koreense]
MKKLKIGLIDFGLRHGRLNSLRVIEDLIEYTQHADRLGFSRFWLAEHHVPRTRAPWSDPQPLVPILAGMTNRIKIGVAGVLISIHTPYHVATTFKLLANLFPGRIDLGLANGIVGETVAQYSIGQSNQVLRSLFETKMRELVHYLQHEDDLYQNGKGVVIPPFKGKIPDLWTLGVSYHTLDRALQLRTNFARSIFHQGSDSTYETEKLQAFREDYYQQHGKYPQITLAVAGCCHQTSQRAKRILTQLNDRKEVGKGDLFGSPAKFHDEVMALQERYQIDEVIFMSAAMQPKDRMVGIELISDVFNLSVN